MALTRHRKSESPQIISIPGASGVTSALVVFGEPYLPDIPT